MSVNKNINFPGLPIPRSWGAVALLAIAIMIGLAIMSFPMQKAPQAKTTSDLMNNPDKSGGDKSPPAVNGSTNNAPSPTVNKGQEIDTFRGGKGKIISTISDVSLGTFQEYIKEGVFDVEIVIYPGNGIIQIQDRVKKVSLPAGQTLFARVRLYDENGLMVFSVGGKSVDYVAEIVLPKEVSPTVEYTTAPVVYYGEITRAITKADIIFYVQETSSPTPTTKPRYV